MAIIRISMYAPVSNIELADGRALSSRVARDWARQVNNMKSYACAHMLIPNNPWPAGSLTAADTTTERFVARWGPVPFPSAFTDVRFAACGRARLAGDQVTLKLYIDRTMYGAGDPIDADGFSDEAKSASLVFTDAASNANKIVTISDYTAGLLTLDGSDENERNVFLTLTKTALDSSDQLYIVNVAAWPMATTL